MFEWISYLLIGITVLRNIQGKMNKSYIWRIAGINDPYFMELDITGKKIINCNQYEVFKILQNKLDFRYELVRPIPKTFGRKQDNGSWTEMFGQIFSKNADMTVIPTFITYNRFQGIDFSTSIIFHQIQFIVKIGGQESNWNSIIRPFTFELWVAVIIVTIIFGILLRQVMKCESSNETSPFRSLPTVIWYLFGTLVFKGGNLNSVFRIPSRFSIALWLLSVVILICSYSGNLMSFMTSPVFEYVPTTFDELASSVKNGKFTCGTLKDSGLIVFLKNSKTGNSKILGDDVISKKNFYNMKDSIASVLKEKFAFIGTYSQLVKMQSSVGIGKLLISEDSLVTFSASYGLRKEFPYKKELHKTLSRLFQSGIINKFVKNGESAERQSTSEIRPLTIEDLLSPFALLFIGFILSVSCVVIELIIAKRVQI